MINITIKTLQKDVYIIHIGVTKSVLDLKKELVKITNIGEDVIRLIYAGKILDDNQIIADTKYVETDFMVMSKKKSKDTPETNNQKATSANIATHRSNDRDKDGVDDSGSDSEDDSSDSSDSSSEDDNNDIQDIQELSRPMLTHLQMLQLINILANDPTIKQLVEAYPSLRDELKDPYVLLELLKRMKHPMLKNFTSIVPKFTAPGKVDRAAIGGPDNPEDNFEYEADVIDEVDVEDTIEIPNISQTVPEIVHITQAEFEELNDIKAQIKDFIGDLSITDAQLNGIIYQVYNMFAKDADATIAFVINKLIDEGL